MQDELDNAEKAKKPGVLSIGKSASTKPKGNFGIKMDIQVEQMEEEDKKEDFGAVNIQKRNSN